MNRVKIPDLPIVVVDDELEVLQSVSTTLVAHGYTNITTLQDSREVLPTIDQYGADLVLLDLGMPHLDGLDVLRRMKDSHPDVPIIVVTATNEIDTAVQCMREGASDYMVKAIESNRLLSGVERTLELRETKRNYAELRRRIFDGRLRFPDAFRHMVTQNNQMHALFLFVEAVTRTRETVLIRGETGVGKDLLAEALHTASGRQGPFVRVNSAGLDDAMFSDAFFGHTRGAFTGADDERKGLVTRAAGGTLFIDEIGDLSKQAQVKLLQLIEKREFYPVGSDLLRRTDARFVVATNRDLDEKVRSGEFRQDLYFRLATHSVSVPPLRRRPDDIPLLLDHFVALAADEFRESVPRISLGAIDLLRRYPFPGNVRELRSLTFDAVARNPDGELTAASFSETVRRGARAGFDDSSSEEMAFGDRLPTIRGLVDQLITEALARSEGNQAIAAGMLGITPAALSKRLHRSQVGNR